MTKRKIILPIKCSTVKNIDKFLNSIINYELYLIWITDILYSLITFDKILVWWVEFNKWGKSLVLEHVPFPEFTIIDIVYFIITVISFIILFIYIFNYIEKFIDYLLNNVPTVECIKDEGEK